jgi:hypothetical protein
MRILIMGALCLAAVVGRADTLVTLDLTAFDMGAAADFQPVGIGDYFLGGTVPNAIGQPITGPNYGIYSVHSTDSLAGADAFGDHAIGWYGSPSGVMYSLTGFTMLSFTWDVNRTYIPEGQNPPPDIYFFDADQTPIAATANYTVTGPDTGIETISSSLPAYSVSFGNPNAMSGRTWGYENVTFDVVSLPAAAPEPASCALFGFGLVGIALVSRKRMKRSRTRFPGPENLHSKPNNAGARLMS